MLPQWQNFAKSGHTALILHPFIRTSLAKKRKNKSPPISILPFEPNFALRKQFQRREQCDQIGRFFKLLVRQMFVQKWPKYLLTFGLTLNTSIYSKNCRVYLLGQLLENLGNFLFQHLVTLEQWLVSTHQLSHLHTLCITSCDSDSIYGQAVARCCYTFYPSSHEYLE